MTDDEDEYEDLEDQWYECDCGFIEYWCELCGYHGHDCETQESYI